MPKTEFYQVPSNDPQEINRILQRIADRLDRLEGIRGDCTIEGSVSITVDENIVHGFNTDEEI